VRRRARALRAFPLYEAVAAAQDVVWGALGVLVADALLGAS